jgi:hypothetical protein
MTIQTGLGNEYSDFSFGHFASNEGPRARSKFRQEINPVDSRLVHLAFLQRSGARKLIILCEVFINFILGARLFLSKLGAGVL